MPITNNNEARYSGKARCTEYQTVSENTRKAIVKYREDNHCSMSFNKMAQDMRVRTPTFKNIVKIYREIGRVEKKQKDGRSHNRINDEHLQFIKDCVDENPSVTLVTIQEKMKNHFDMERPYSISGIDFALKTESSIH
ncbi:hypothetical protein G6F56_008281 [Rhizopus delemar]|nr:hypothetical protein G6F56_008281 [Rhizopus delemar]